jgi:hypothetical protein
MNAYAIRNFPHEVDIVIIERQAIVHRVENIVLHSTDKKGIYRLARHLHSSLDPVYIYLDPLDSFEFDLLEAVGIPKIDTDEFDATYTLLIPQLIENMDGTDQQYTCPHRNATIWTR